MEGISKYFSKKKRDLIDQSWGDNERIKAKERSWASSTDNI